MHACAFALGVLAALRVPGPLSPRNANYRLQASLDPDTRTVTGHERITWRNSETGPATELVFHLYMNAFKNEHSTFLRESHGRLGSVRFEPHGWGAIDVSRLVVGGVDRTAALKVDDTLATVTLERPVAPGQEVAIDVDFKTLLPKAFARTGYAGDFFAVAQWFPKIAVWQCESGLSSCRWRAHQHHANSEFFSDFGVYDVDVELPARFEVGATGVRVGERSDGARKTLRFHAEDVSDFVFVASPRFRRTVDRFTDSNGAVEIVLLGVADHQPSAPRHLAQAKATLAELERRFGPYPYSQLTIVEPPASAQGASGMEYPTLFFTLDLPVPRAFHLPELVTAHELTHQYFQGILASDEVEEAWLDEGLTETLTDLVLARTFGPGGIYDLWGHTLSQSDASRLAFRRVADLDPIATRSFDFATPRAYGAITYGKSDALLRTVENLLGAERFERGLRRYFDLWKFRHPRRADFVRAFDEGAGEELSWLWQPGLERAQVLDYQVLSVEVRRQARAAGLYDADGGTRTEVEVAESEKAPWTSEVTIHRRGEMLFPVEVEVTFDNGTRQRERWDGGRSGGPRWRRFVYQGERRVIAAEVDPEHKVLLDASRWNDGLRAPEAADPGPRRRLRGSFFTLLSAALAWVGF